MGGREQEQSDDIGSTIETSSKSDFNPILINDGMIISPQIRLVFQVASISIKINVIIVYIYSVV